MSSSITPGTIEPESSSPRVSRGRFWLWVLLALAGWLGYVLSLELRNPRLVASWHGFLHTAIANRFPGPEWTPENPFFAGEPLRYYWVFHRIAAAVGDVSHLDPLTALRLLTLTGLVLLVITAALLGRRLYGSAGAGILIGYLALVGLNPLGPGIAGARHLKGMPLFEQETGGPVVETVFVSNELADQLMSRKLLPSMYFSTDWRQGQNVVWFFDISSRGLALGVLMALLLVVVRPAHRWPHLVATGLVTAALVALNPIVGLAVSGGLGFSWLLQDWLARRRDPTTGFPHVAVVIALAVGVLVAAPTFIQLFSQGGGTTTINPPGMMASKLVNMALNFLVVAVLVLLALRISLGQRTGGLRAAAITGALLLLLVAVVHLEEGNEHNLTNAALVLLAVPAVAPLVLARNGDRLDHRKARRRLWVVALLFVPMTLGTWLAFDGRPPLPFQASGGALIRVPESDPLASLYAWIMQGTDNNAVFVVNPARPVKMSGNVSELPAFTARTLFTDQASYLTTVYQDATMRAALSGRLLEGEAVSADERRYLERLNRPLYIVSYQPEQAVRLGARYGNPVFHRDFVTVFQWK